MAFQDIKNDWTELDPGTFINTDTADTRADYVNMSLQIDAYFSRDFGAGHFTNFTHLITAYVSAVASSFAVSGYSIGTTTDDIYGQSDALQVYWYAYIGILRLYIRDASDDDRDYWGLGSLSTPYYLKPIRTGTTWSMEIYDDGDARTNLVDTVGVTGTNTAFQFGLIAQSGNLASGDRSITGYWKDLDIQEAAVATLLMMHANQLGNIGHRLTGGMQL